MRGPRRVLGVARVRFLEGVRGPLGALLVLFLTAAVLILVLTPGEAGPERQKALDGWMLDAALLVGVLGAAVLGATSLAADRDSGRAPLLAATSLRSGELLAGGFLGHLACLALLLLGCGAALLALTGWFAGGDRDRHPTRVPLRATRLEDGAGRPVPSGVVRLTVEHPETVFVLDAPRRALPPGRDEVPAWIQVHEFPDNLSVPLPAVYPVGIRVDGGPQRVVNVRTGNPLRFTLSREEVRQGGGTRVAVRRLEPVYSLTLVSGGLVVEGPSRSFRMNVAKALLGWFLGLAVVLAVATALSTLVGAPIGAAGGLLFVLVARSLGLIEETAGYVAARASTGSAMARDVLRAVAAVVPDLDSFDLTTPVVRRWDVAPRMLGDLVPPAAIAVAVLLLAAWLVAEIRRRR